MRWRGTTDGLLVWAPAKLNLFLEVLGKRSDGFHEIETLMCPIDLYDTLLLQPSAQGETQLRVVDQRDKDACRQLLPAGDENLVLRAVERVRRETGDRRGVRLTLVKRIPLAAGLAGGSSDAAATLVGLDRLWGLGLEAERIAALAAELGSDVPFFLAGKSAVCRGRGERIELAPGLGRWSFVVVHPRQGLSTASVFAACRAAVAPRTCAPLVGALRAGNRRALASLLHNQLQPAAESLAPVVGELSRQFARFDVLAHQMSGSGTSYFGVCRSARQARRLAATLQGQGAGGVYAVQSCA